MSMELIEAIQKIDDKRATKLLAILRAHEMNARGSAKRHFKDAANHLDQSRLRNGIEEMLEATNREAAAIAYDQAIQDTIKAFTEEETDGKTTE